VAREQPREVVSEPAPTFSMSATFHG
jgi:hypothetical protein